MYYDPHKSSIANLDANLVALMIYLLPMLLSFFLNLSSLSWILPLVVFFVEKDSDFVKFHCVQAVLLQLIPAVISMVFAMITTILGGAAMITGFMTSFSGILSSITTGAFGLVVLAVWIVVMAISLFFFVFKVIAMIKAYNYKLYEVPLIGRLATRIMAHTH